MNDELLIENSLLSSANDQYDHISFIIPTNKILNELKVEFIITSITIFYKIQEDTSGTYYGIDENREILTSGSIENSDQNKNILSESLLSGKTYSILFL